jgi:hypothetical protein
MSEIGVAGMIDFASTGETRTSCGEGLRQATRFLREKRGPRQMIVIHLPCILAHQ